MIWNLHLPRLQRVNLQLSVPPARTIVLVRLYEQGQTSWMISSTIVAYLVLRFIQIKTRGILSTSTSSQSQCTRSCSFGSRHVEFFLLLLPVNRSAHEVFFLLSLPVNRSAHEVVLNELETNVISSNANGAQSKRVQSKRAQSKRV